MGEKLWCECSKEERRLVNRIARCHRAFNYLHNNNLISTRKYNSLVLQEKYALDLCEWYFSDEITDKRDFANWRDGFMKYQEVRNKL